MRPCTLVIVLQIARARAQSGPFVLIHQVLPADRPDFVKTRGHSIRIASAALTMAMHSQWSTSCEFKVTVQDKPRKVFAATNLNVGAKLVLLGANAHMYSERAPPAMRLSRSPVSPPIAPVLSRSNCPGCVRGLAARSSASHNSNV